MWEEIPASFHSSHALPVGQVVELIEASPWDLCVFHFTVVIIVTI